MTASAPLLQDKYTQKFFTELAEKLDELFPKTNQDNPTIPSKGNRTTALVLNAYANIIFRKLITEFEQEIIKLYVKKT